MHRRRHSHRISAAQKIERADDSFAFEAFVAGEDQRFAGERDLVPPWADGNLISSGSDGAGRDCQFGVAARNRLAGRLVAGRSSAISMAPFGIPARAVEVANAMHAIMTATMRTPNSLARRDAR